MTEEKKMKNKSIALFGEQGIRREWDAEEEKWWFSIIDVVQALTGTDNPRRYWSDLKRKLQDEGSQLYDKIVQLKLMSSDGKKYKTDVADQIQLLRIIQSIPSKKAEPFKCWLAEVGSERLDQMADPERSIHQALRDYKRLGYSDSWIDQRLKSIEIRKDLTDSWANHGVAGGQFALLTDIIYKTWAGKTAKEYKEHKGLKKENLRDNMTNGELLMNMLAEYSTTSITNAKNPQTYNENIDCAKEDATRYKNNIAMLRRMRGLTQVYMAKKLGVARQTYINIEKGLKELTLSQVRILEDELQVSFDDLLGVGEGNGQSVYRKYL